MGDVINRSWAVRGVELPFGDRIRECWIDPAGTRFDSPIEDAHPLPGSFFVAGLVDCHAHPAVAAGSAGPAALDSEETRANLIAWVETGITLVRDVGSPGGITLDLNLGAQQGSDSFPEVRAAGRFLAPDGRYFADLLVEAVGEADLADAAVREVERGATWVKVIADFPRVPEFDAPARTYPLHAIAQLCDAAHRAGARVAAHTTLAGVQDLVGAGVDSIEHGTQLDLDTVVEMGRRGVAWTPTLCAVLADLDRPDAASDRRQRAEETRARMAELLPAAVKAGVPVLAGTDVVGSIAREVAMLAQLGLDPRHALAAASDWAREYVAPGETRPDIVTYDADPREDPEILGRPAAVVVAGRRIR